MRNGMPGAGALVIVFLLIGGCTATPISVVGGVTYAACPANFHTIAYPNNLDPKKAYGCKSNDAGFSDSRVSEREELTSR
jgi:hypothetical protein